MWLNRLDPSNLFPRFFSPTSIKIITNYDNMNLKLSSSLESHLKTTLTNFFTYYYDYDLKNENQNLSFVSEEAKILTYNIPKKVIRDMRSKFEKIINSNY